jgi:hypothetical protein
MKRENPIAAKVVNKFFFVIPFHLLHLLHPKKVFYGSI